MVVKLAPSKNPKKESKQFATLALIFGIASLLIWFFGIASIGTGVRGAILSSRVKNNKYLAFSIIGIILGLIAIGYYYMNKA